MTVRIKICGFTLRKDLLEALRLGVDAIGLNFYPKSPRYIDPQRAREMVEKAPPFGLRVGIFVDPTFESIMEAARTVRLDTIQLHGSEPPEIAEDIRNEGFRVWKAIRVSSLEALRRYEDYPCDALVLDAFDPSAPGGTGKKFDWSMLSGWKPTAPWILSGGLNAESVGEAITRLHPDGVDVASGIETKPGVKNHELMKLFIERARQADNV